MRAILSDLETVPGVNGSFVCDRQGKVVARALPDLFDDELLDRVGSITSRAIIGLETAGEVGDLDLAFSDGRLIVKDLESGALCILCDPDINASFLSLSAGLAVKKLKLAIAEFGNPELGPTLREQIREIVVRELGEHSGRALDILEQSPDEPEALARSSQAIVRLTRLFISTRKSDEIDRLLTAAISRHQGADSR